MTIPEIFEEQPRFFLSDIDRLPYWEAVYSQAVTHTRRRLKDEHNRLLHMSRPNESEEIKDYREANERQITRSGFDMFLAKASRIIKNSNIRYDSLSESLTEYLDTKPFTYLGQRLNFNDYLLNCILKESLESPNSLIVAFPLNELNPDIPPAAPVSEGGLPNTEPVNISVQIIQHDRITYLDEKNLVYEGGVKAIEYEGYIQEATYYFAADEFNWYLLDPEFIREDGHRKLTYKLILWYSHNTGESLINFLPGEKSSSKDGAIMYHESYIRSYYDIADEVVQAFSDDQAVRIRFSYPIVAMKEVKCYNPDCQNGYIGGIKDPDKPNNNACHVCSGSGKISWPSPYGTIVKPTSNLVQAENANDSVLEFMHPELGFVQHSFDTVWRLFEKAKKSIGLDLMEGTASESGRAKEIRMEDLTDKLTRIADGLYSCAQKLLWHIESLLVINPANREKPLIRLPITYKVKDLFQLKDDAEESIAEDKIQARLDYYTTKYQGDPELVKMYEIALMYSPLLTMTDQDIQLRLAAGVYDQNDLIKRDYAVIALKDLGEDIDFSQIKNRDAFKLIDEYLQERGLLMPDQQVLFGEEEPAAEAVALEEVTGNKLLETVGGVQGLIGLSQAVASGKMTEAAAESIIVEIYGVSREVASRMIDTPKQADIDKLPEEFK